MGDCLNRTLTTRNQILAMGDVSMRWIDKSTKEGWKKQRIERQTLKEDESFEY